MSGFADIASPFQYLLSQKHWLGGTPRPPPSTGPSPTLAQVSRGSVLPRLRSLRGWLHSLARRPVPGLHFLSSENYFPNIQLAASRWLLHSRGPLVLLPGAASISLSLDLPSEQLQSARRELPRPLFARLNKPRSVTLQAGSRSSPIAFCWIFSLTLGELEFSAFSAQARQENEANLKRKETTNFFALQQAPTSQSYVSLQSFPLLIWANAGSRQPVPPAGST